MIDTLTGQRQDLSSLSKTVLERLNIFRSKASELDRVILVFATEEPLNESEQDMLNKIRVIGRDKLGQLFDVDAISIKTIFKRLQDITDDLTDIISIPIKAVLDPGLKDLRVGTVSLLDLYAFLKAYQTQTGDLNLLFEKNVRHFLGTQTRVNKKMRDTLQKMPDQFGLYNNGITIVVRNYQDNDDNTIQLVEPYIVNGGQTTRTIWDVCYNRLESGGTGSSRTQEEWYAKASKGVVVTKIVKVGAAGEELLQNIARFTNSQNAIREQDFLALVSDFDLWAERMEKDYHVFMETQRGKWESYQADQRNRKASKVKEHANAFDLIKVYGAGWMGLPGLAFGDNTPFIPPSGTIYKQIIEVNRANNDEFGTDDLYAAYRLKISADKYGFGGKSADTKPSRGQTRYMFYMVVLDLLEDVLVWSNTKKTPKELTRALLKLFKKENEAVADVLLDMGVQLIDEYFSDGEKILLLQNLSFKSSSIRT